MKINLNKFLLALARADLTISELSKLSGISASAISKIKSSGTARPKTLGKIAKSLGVDVTEIIE